MLFILEQFKYVLIYAFMVNASIEHMEYTEVKSLFLGSRLSCEIDTSTK